MKLSRLQRVIAVERKIVEAMLAKKSSNQISREFHVGKRRVRRIGELARAAGYLDGSLAIPPFPLALFASKNYRAFMAGSETDTELLSHLDFVKERLVAGWRPISVFEELPIKVGRSSFYRFLERHKLENLGEHHRYAVPEIIHHPGEALLVDWGKLCTAVNPATGKRQTLWAFVGVLGFSRYMMVRLMWCCDTTATLDALAGMFEELGGVPARVTSDNPKVFALEASRYEALVNPAYERFAAHYDFSVECLPPRDPEKKGKVERPMPYVRRLFESYRGESGDIAAAQQFMEKKLVIANERKHGTTLERPIDRLVLEEVNALKPLPALAHEREEFQEGTVRKDGHVRFRGKYYSLSDEYKGKDVQIIGTSKVVHIFFAGKLIETHDRVHCRLQSKSTKSQHLAPWARALEEVSVYRSRAQNIGPNADRLITAIIGAGRGFIDFRRVWGILSLTKSYSAAQVEEACRQALECQTLSYRTVHGFAKAQVQGKGGEPRASDAGPSPSQIRHGTNKFVRAIREYEEVIATQQKERKMSDEQCRESQTTIH